MTSIRLRVALVAIAVVASVLATGGWIIAEHLSAMLAAEFDRLLAQRLTSLATGLEFERGRLEIHGQGPQVLAVAVLTPEGVRLRGPAGTAPPSGLAIGAPPILVDGLHGDGRPCRWGWTLVAPEDEDHGRTHHQLVVGIAMDPAPVRQQMQSIRRTLLVGSLLTAAATAAILALALGRMLRPHAVLADQVRTLDPRRAVRLPVAGLPSELRAVAERINDLCDRLDRAYGLAATLHAAAAHELRTPLAGMRATIEVASQGGGDPLAALATCHAIAMQMQARIDNLLMAARIDAGQLNPRCEEIDVHDLLRSGWASVGPQAARERGLSARWELAGEGLAQADREALRMVIGNLLDNAVSHAPAGSVLDLACADDGAFCRITIANPAPGMSPAAAEQVFTRGWRSGSTSGDTRHAGLGTSICRELIALMSGRISGELTEGRFSVTIVLPAAGQFEYW